MILNKGNSIKVAGKKCLNKFHNNVQCNYCLGHCPSKAIFYEDHKIFLDRDQCIGCGLCLQDCPTQVFSSNLWDETSIIFDIQQANWITTEIFCGKHVAPYKKESGEERGAIQIPACLSAISRGAWYELGLSTKLELHLEACEACPMQETINRLNHNIYIVSEWLEASGHAMDISFITQSSKGKTKKNLKAVKSALKVTSRRDFFLTIANKVKPHIESNTKEHGYGVNKNQESLLPGWHKRLAQVYTENMQESGELAYWPTIKKSSACRSCGMCNIVCPTKTLHNEVKGENFEQYFTSGLCIDCRICQIFCPQGAITRDREKVARPFEAISLYSGIVRECERCGYIVCGYASELCYWCSEEDKQNNDAMDYYRKLLLNRGKKDI